jgi:predicted dienelactone hydrolase
MKATSAARAAILAAGMLAVAAVPANGAPVGHRVERLVVPGAAQGELRAVDVHLWYPAEAASALARPKAVYTSPLNGRAVIPGKTPLSWTIEAEVAREGAAIEPAGAAFPVIVFSHGNNNDPIDYAYTLEELAAAGFIVAAPYHTNNSQDEVRIDYANAQGATPPIPCKDGRSSPCSRLDVPFGMADRVRDVSTILSTMPTWFGSRADTARAGLFGHSRGTVTALATAGGSDAWPLVTVDRRFQAIMGMAIGTQAMTSGIRLADVKVPVLLVGGTLDATSPLSVSRFARDGMTANPDKLLIEIKDGYHRTFDSTYCDQVKASGTIAAADQNAVMDKQTFDQIALHPTSGRPQDYCAPSTFTQPVADLLFATNGFRVTATNVPTSGLETNAIKTQMSALAVQFFTAKLARAAGGGVSGTVPATLALTLEPAASFGTFTPGVAFDYTASTSARVISTAGDAALTVSDPGHLMNGTFALPQALRVEINPASWTLPVSNATSTITFRQAIAATDALRTGAYTRTLTFTLSTTTP